MFSEMFRLLLVLNLSIEISRELPMVTLLSAARLITLTPILSALRMASSICRLMPFFADGMKYCNSTGKNKRKQCEYWLFLFAAMDVHQVMRIQAS